MKLDHPQRLTNFIFILLWQIKRVKKNKVCNKTCFLATGLQQQTKRIKQWIRPFKGFTMCLVGTF